MNAGALAFLFAALLNLFIVALLVIAIGPPGMRTPAAVLAFLAGCAIGPVDGALQRKMHAPRSRE